MATPSQGPYQARNPPSEIGDEETHQPGGELHAVAPSENPELDLEVEDDDQGTLPNELQVRSVTGSQHLPEFRTTEASGSFAAHLGQPK